MTVNLKYQYKGSEISVSTTPEGVIIPLVIEKRNGITSSTCNLGGFRSVEDAEKWALRQAENNARYNGVQSRAKRAYDKIMETLKYV